MSLQALIPPCAQTLWLRFTGTMENRSTATPSSASFTHTASPASPPPTTITRLFDAAAMMMSLQRLAELRPLLVNELQVMLEVLGIDLERLQQGHLAALVVHTKTLPRGLRSAAQHPGK